MVLKIIFMIVFIAMLASLMHGLYHLIRYKEKSAHLLQALIARISCAALVLILLIYGLYIGDFHLSAPWLGA
ncbi:MAG: DUF2909 domain-containing protein [Endozoicomonadaceae bacterium]|nr:DUF2909 domain-containing protein [Endozoicomonadaceae bacterium]